MTLCSRALFIVLFLSACSAVVTAQTSSYKNPVCEWGAVNTTLSNPINSPGSQAATPGATTNIFMGQSLIIDTGTNAETVTVTAVSGTTFTADFTKTHAAGAPIAGGSQKYQAGTLTSANVKVMIAGSSSLWQTLALGAFNQGSGVLGATANTHHYVSNGNFSLIDYRPLSMNSSNSPIFDSGQVWIVWDEKTTYVAGAGFECTPNVWAYLRTDSGIEGNRAFFSSAGSENNGYGVWIVAPTVFPPGGSTSIANQLWDNGANSLDDLVPPNIQALFSAPKKNFPLANVPNLVDVGATDVRPEDAFFFTTRTNSVLGNCSPAGATTCPDGSSTDGLDGLGYVNAAATGPNSMTPGAAPANCSGSTPVATLADLEGQSILGSEPNADLTPTVGIANVSAFNVTGQDPFTCNEIGEIHTIAVGAVPMVFVHSNGGGQLAGLSNATETQLSSAFSGFNTNASAFGLPSGPIEAFLREPISGAMHTVEQDVFRHPSSISTYRRSQESNNGSMMPNPLSGNDDSHSRFRAIGPFREVVAVKNAVINHGNDGIGYTFFSYSNVSSIANTTNYSYISLDSADPIWHNYQPGTVGISDPGQPTKPGMLPAVTPCGNTVATAFPCNENQIWAPSKVAFLSPLGVVTSYNSYSYPNLRNGSYPAWSVFRLVAGPAWLNATTLVNAANPYVVSTVPDYVPFSPIKQGTYPNYVYLDPGLTIVRSHYGCLAVTCGLNFFGTAANPPFQGALERGRDAGGAILPIGDFKVNYTQDGPQGMVVFE